MRGGETAEVTSVQPNAMSDGSDESGTLKIRQHWIELTIARVAKHGATLRGWSGSKLEPTSAIDLVDESQVRSQDRPCPNVGDRPKVARSTLDLRRRSIRRAEGRAVELRENPLYPGGGTKKLLVEERSLEDSKAECLSREERILWR